MCHFPAVLRKMALACLLLVTISLNPASVSGQTVPIVRASSVRVAGAAAPVQYAIHRTHAHEDRTWEWRHDGTRWQRVPLDRPAPVQRLNLSHPRPLIHPLRYATMVILFVMMAVTWSSDEWQWSRLVRDD